MFDRDTLYNYVWDTLEKELGDCVKTDYLTDRICDAVSEWLPKQGDFWLTDEGTLWVNHGWREVTPAGVSPEGLESIATGDPWLETLTPEQRQMRQRKIDATADDLDHIIWLDSNDLQT